MRIANNTAELVGNTLSLNLTALRLALMRRLLASWSILMLQAA